MRKNVLAGIEIKDRRSVVDALEVLRKESGFDASNHARVRVAQMEYQPGRVATLLRLEFENRATSETDVVWLPAASQVMGKAASSSDSIILEPLALEGGVVDFDGHVVTKEGVQLRAISILPAEMPIEPSAIKWRILKLTLRFIKLEEECLRSLRKGLPEHLHDMVPDRYWIDCSKLRGHKLPSLDSITAYVRENDPSLRKVSAQTVADALQAFAMHVPKKRPRKANDAVLKRQLS